MRRAALLAVLFVVALVAMLSPVWDDLRWDGRYGTTNRCEFDQRLKVCDRYRGDPWFDTCMTIEEPD